MFEMTEMHGRVYAVSGAASGIGFATAELLLRLGATVSICDVDAPALHAAHATLSASYPAVIASHIDISNPELVRWWICKTVSELGRLDGAANVAGVIGNIHGVTSVEDMDHDQWDLIIRVNLKGTMLCMKEQLKVMRAAAAGSIVNVSSIHGLLGFAKHSAYDASKHAIIGLTKSAAQEYGPLGIRINALAPGEVSTPLMMQSTSLHGEQGYASRTALKRAGTASEIAKSIAFLLSDHSSYITGATLCADGGWGP